MNYSNYPFTLDIHSVVSQISFPVSLNDTARSLIISLTDGGKPYEIADGCRAVLAGVKPDGTRLLNDCIIVGNKTIRYDFTKQTTSVVGKADCEIRLYGVDGKIIASPRFTIVVYENLLDEKIVSEDEKTTLDTIIGSENQRVAAENARVAAENEREGVAEQARDLTEAASRILEDATHGVYLSEGEKSVVQGLSNKAISESSSAWGKGNLAGLKGFRIIERTDNGDGTGTYTLDGYTGGYDSEVIKNFYDNEILDNSPNTEYKYRKLKIDLENGEYAWSLPENNFTGAGLYVLFTDDIAYEGSGTASDCFTSWIGHDSVETLNHTSGTFTVTKGYVYLAFAGNKLPNLKGLLAPMRIDSVPATILEEGDVYSIRYEYIWEKHGAIKAIDGNKITVYNYVDTQMEYLGDNTEDRNCFWVVDKPTVGNLDIGKWTAAFGYKCKAIGKGSFAAGVGSEATGSYSVATGNGCEAIGYASNATGRDTVASGQQSDASGWKTSASGEASHSEGYKTTASGKNSHAEGESTEASAQGSHAEGSSAKAQSFASHAEGWKSEANHTAAHAEGEQTVAGGEASHTEGFQTSATEKGSHAEGFQTSATANGSHAEGERSAASGAASHAEGVKTNATMSAAHAEGQETQSTSYASHAEGYKTKATASNAHAEGESTEASGIDSHAEGKGTKATAYYAHAEGQSSVASAQASHAEGVSSEASSYGSHAEGWKSKATTNSAAHAEGIQSEASGEASHAEGRDTKATGKCSHSEGIGTIANGMYQHVQGRFNIADTLDGSGVGKYAHIIGNGWNDTSRSNAYTLDWNGNAWFAGAVNAAGGSLTVVDGSYIGSTSSKQDVFGDVTIDVGFKPKILAIAFESADYNSTLDKTFYGPGQAVYVLNYTTKKAIAISQREDTNAYVETCSFTVDANGTSITISGMPNRNVQHDFTAIG